MKSFGSMARFLWALLLVLLAFICTGNAFKQELWLYDAQDDAIQFHSNVADMSDYSLLLPKVTSYCSRGFWYVFSEADFQTYVTNRGSPTIPYIICANITTGSVKSLRHFGATDTDTDALSLYEGSDYTGKEILVTARAQLGITNQIESIGITGASEWTLFEGQALDGRSACYKMRSGFYADFSIVRSLNLTTIGSVLKGCDLQEIQNYKRFQAS